MICKVSYELRRTLPGTEYDYEKLYAENLLSETEEKRTPQEMISECINLVCSNTAAARLKRSKGE